MHVLLAANFLDPLTHGVAFVIGAIDSVVHNRGWSLVLFALALKLLFWPLNVKQFMAMVKMQELGPQLKAMQARNKEKEEQLKRRIKDADQLKKAQLENQQAMQRDTMDLYKKNGANPLAGCWPMLVQYPFLVCVFYAVTLPQYRHLYQGQHWAWIGSAITAHLPVLPFWKQPLLAASLGAPDLVLLVLYMISMYLFSRYATMPSADPQQANTQKMMAIVSPVMLGYMGFQWKWPSAMVLYWFSFNVLTMAQQFYLLKRNHKPLSILDNEHAVTDIPDKPAAAASAGNGAVKTSKNQKKKGAKR
ncbi:MAG: membrane protein insertase YidC [Candidatus Baltobacteraceae bacterium]